MEPGGIKHRLISDCRELNKTLDPPKFKLDNIQQIFPVIQKGMQAIKVDLKNAYFHLCVAEKAQLYLCMQVGDKFFCWEGAPFGLSTLPYLFQSLMKTLLKKWRSKGMLVWVYLDDILLVSKKKKTLVKERDELLKDLETVGLIVNTKKSVLEPTQNISYLGFQLNFSQGVLEVPAQKVKTVRKELGKLVTHKELTPRKMAAILGTVRSFLTALPFLRAFTDKLCSFVDLNVKFGWDSPQPIPWDLQEQIRNVKEIIDNWKGRSMLGEDQPTRSLHSDSSGHGWGGKDLLEGTELQEFWRDQSGLHINVKELLAAIATVKSLAKRGERVLLGVDNSVAYSYLRKQGGKKGPFNETLRPFLEWCQENQVVVQPTLVQSHNMLADSLSRKGVDKGDYTLCQNVFLHLQSLFHPFVQPSIDMFSSPGNAQLQNWVSRYPHWGAWGVNALELDLSPVESCWANPPWNLVSRWLVRLRSAPWVKCLLAVPWWVGSSWWPLLVKLHVRGTPVVLVQPREGLFQNCLGEKMPPTRWPLLCLMLSGASWRENKFRLKVSHYI